MASNFDIDKIMKILDGKDMNYAKQLINKILLHLDSYAIICTTPKRLTKES